jgi:DNA-binding NarL/FixJ family response regulator
MVGLDHGASGGAGPRDGAPVRVLICDDHEVLRHGLRTVLRWAPEIVVVAETGDAEEALALAGRLSPDVTLVGLGARGPVVQDLVAALTGLGVRVILLGQADADGDVVDALRAGARGYVHSTASPERLLDGVRAVAHGETVLDAAVANELLHRLDNGHRRGAEPQPAPSLLTARQQAVSALVAEGLTNAEIADRLRVSKATVKGHITVALRRLGLRDRTQLAIHVHRTVRPEADRAEGPLSG